MSKNKRRGGRYCVAGAPNQQSCMNSSYTEGISMHQFPKDQKTFDKWEKFVQRHRRDFKAKSKYTSLCSAHFEESCYQFPIQLDGIKMAKVLKKGSIPTIDAVNIKKKQPTVSARRKRQLKREIFAEVHVSNKNRKIASIDANYNDNGTSSDQSRSHTGQVGNNIPEETLSTEDSKKDQSAPIHSIYCESNNVSAKNSETTAKTPLSSSASEQSSNIMRNLQRSNNRLKKRCAELRKTIRNLSRKCPDTETESENEDNAGEETYIEEGGSPSYYHWSSNGSECSDQDTNDTDWKGHTDESTEDDYSGDNLDEAHTSNHVHVPAGISAVQEPKFIVFYSQLLALFSLFCFNCQAEEPVVTMKTRGTMVTVIQSCKKCLSGYTWKSQPLVLGSLPAGNILLSFSVLMAGATISKILLVFRHMGLCVYSSRSFFSHQNKFLFPTILHYWDKYRTGLLEKLRAMKDTVWCGDGRFDSMGHSAKYGVYTMLSTTILKIVHFELVQANETGGSNQTELEGAKRSFLFLKQAGLKVETFVSDRHRGIAKWIRENCKDTIHNYDIWHLAKSLTKKLLAASQENGCEIIKDWLKAIRRHVYWCATSTKSGFGELILAKWKSFIRHISNVHKDHPDPLYKECSHKELEPRKWIRRGTAAYDKLDSIVNKKVLLDDIKKLSPDAQTSALEGFHATLNYWHPKMMAFSWMGTMCRHILASLHFNENVCREPQVSKNGEKYFNVTYPKFKLGEEVVREVSAPPSYDYVDTMKDLLFTLTSTERESATRKYSVKQPKPLNTKFPERIDKTEAVKSYAASKNSKSITLFPSGPEQVKLQQQLEEAKQSSQLKDTVSKKTPHCKTCGKTMKGHKKAECSKNTDT